MRWYFFDMDHTLINNDCDVSWKQFAVKHHLADASALQEADDFFEDYKAGKLNIDQFLQFQLREFAGKTPDEMKILAQQHFREFVQDKIYADAVALINKLRQQPDVRLGILTSTNSVIAGPVAEYLQFEFLLGASLELGADGKYTGKVAGIYPAGPGKASTIRAFLAAHGGSVENLAYYGDSINDVDILSIARWPHAVNAVPALEAIAVEKGWNLLSFQNGGYWKADKD